MTRSLNGDIRGRVIGAVQQGIPPREAVRRFRIGTSTELNTLAALPPATTEEHSRRRLNGHFTSNALKGYEPPTVCRC